MPHVRAKCKEVKMRENLRQVRQSLIVSCTTQVVDNLLNRIMQQKKNDDDDEGELVIQILKK